MAKHDRKKPISQDSLIWRFTGERSPRPHHDAGPVWVGDDQGWVGVETDARHLRAFLQLAEITRDEWGTLDEVSRQNIDRAAWLVDALRVAAKTVAARKLNKELEEALFEAGGQLLEEAGRVYGKSRDSTTGFVRQVNRYGRLALAIQRMPRLTALVVEVREEARAKPTLADSEWIARRMGAISEAATGTAPGAKPLNWSDLEIHTRSDGRTVAARLLEKTLRVRSEEVLAGRPRTRSYKR